MRERREVVIVGGGPAGATAALLLARAGHDVLVLERARMPRPKACGDCLSAQASRVLARFGVLPAIEALAPARLDGWRVVAPDGAAVTAAFADIADDGEPVTTALAVPRDRLDAALLACAAAAGAEVRTGAHVTDVLACGARTEVVVRGAATPIDARLVIGADGLRSVVARRIGAVRRPPRLRKLSLTAHARVPGLDSYGEMHLARGACLGLARVSASDDTCNVTLVVTDAAPPRTPRDGSRHARLDTFVRERLTAFPALHGRLDDVEVDPAEGWLASGPFDRPTRRVVADGVALTGDAAGYYDPFTGQGIHTALVAAEQLAFAAMRALARPGAIRAERLASYATAHARLTRGPQRVQRLIEAALSREPTARAAIRLLARSAPLRSLLLGVTGDLLPPRALLEPRRIASTVHSLLRAS